MINAIIRQGDITIITELPKNLSELRQELFSSGVRSNPSDLKLFDDEGNIEVQVYSDQLLGQHLGAMLTTDDTLATANLATYLLKNVDSTIKEGIQEKVLADGYTSAEELIDDIRDQTYQLGPYKLPLLFPISGEFYEYGQGPFTASDAYIHDFWDEISSAVNDLQNRDVEDIASFFNDDATLKAKLVAATWSVEEQNEHQLMGLCTLHLRENITLEEKEILRDWVLGQNADGAFESLEDYPIETGEGTLRVSLWNDGDDYFVKDRMELDEYIAQQSGLKMGGI